MNQREDALQEVKILKSLQHENIIRFIGMTLSGKNKSDLLILMEYAANGDLQQMIDKNKNRGEFFKENKIIDWLIQLCWGLKHTHSKHVIHRDLKAQNIFLKDNNILKIGDFGLSKALSSSVAFTATTKGTPYYISPEIARGDSYTYTSDIWALGVILYQLCNLDYPFDGATLPDLFESIKYSPVKPHKGKYSAALLEAVDAMLIKDSAKRLKLDELLKKDFIQARMKKMFEESINTENIQVEGLDKNEEEVIDLDFSSVDDTKKAEERLAYVTVIGKDKIGKSVLIDKFLRNNKGSNNVDLGFCQIKRGNANIHLVVEKIYNSFAFVEEVKTELVPLLGVIVLMEDEEDLETMVPLIKELKGKKIVTEFCQIVKGAKLTGGENESQLHRKDGTPVPVSLVRNMNSTDIFKLFDRIIQKIIGVNN